MISKQKRFFNNVASVCVLFALVVFFTAPLQARIYLNKTETAFVDDPSGTTSLSSVSGLNSFESMLMKGAGYYLKSHSYGLLASNNFEMSDLEGINWTELTENFDQAVSYMEMAKDAYIAIVDKANNTPYNQKVIEKLVNFDYFSFKSAYGLNSVVFSDAKDFLKNGDVRGIYAEVLSRIDTILAELYKLQTNVDSKMFPSNSSIWRLNQLYSETQLFGQYTAEIFYAALSE